MTTAKFAGSLVDYVMLHFKKGQTLLPGSRPGFSHALKLSHSTIDPSRISIGDSTKKQWNYRYRLSPHVPKYSVGLFTALMDDLSTDACFRVGLPSAPGLSLQMQTEVVDKVKARERFLNPTEENSEVDIINSVTKLGKTISHTRTDFRCAQTQELICFSSHVKYMPSGSAMLDQLFGNRFLYEWYLWLALQESKIPVYEEKPLLDDVIRSNLEYCVDNAARSEQSDGSRPLATFNCSTEHTNPFGALHGGCHAMVMEQVALTHARSVLHSDNILLEAMQVEYISAGPTGPVDVYCENIGEPSFHEDGQSIHVRVFIKQPKSGRICSEGKLRLSAF